MISAGSSSPETAEKEICKICKRQFSRYTCPKCNVAYCSLTCFRSEAHSQCSETFYRKEIESDIHTEPSKSMQERQKMMDLLKRFEEQAADDDLGSSSDDDDQENSLARRLKDVDLDHASPDDLWEMLTATERDKFIKALDNPSSELAQQLLADEELEKDRQEPWWDGPSLQDHDSSHTQKKFGVKPKMMTISTKMVQTRPGALCLVYNIAAVFMAYAYATRSLSRSPLASVMVQDIDHGEARRIISQLVPFLVDRKSKTLFPSLSAAVTSVWSRFDPGRMTSQSFSVLLRDTAYLLRPANVLVLPPTPSDGPQLPSLNLDEEVLNSHPSSTALLGLSDLLVLFQNIRHDQRNEGPANTPNHVNLKLVFYAAYILTTPSHVLKGLADEILIWSKKVEDESAELLAGESFERMSTVRVPPFVSDDNLAPLIEDVSGVERVKSTFPPGSEDFTDKL